MGEIIIFAKNGGNVLKQGKQRENSNKGHQKFWPMKIENFSGKGKI